VGISYTEYYLNTTYQVSSAVQIVCDLSELPAKTIMSGHCLAVVCKSFYVICTKWLEPCRRA